MRTDNVTPGSEASRRSSTLRAQHSRTCGSGRGRMAITTWLVAAALTSVIADPPAPDASTREKLKYRAIEGNWKRERKHPHLTRSVLIQSVEAARTYMVNQQLPAGNFTYMFDLLRNSAIEDDNQVRQAGTIWALASLCRDRPTDATHNATVRALDYFFRISKPVALGYTAPVYETEAEVKTGTVALLCLAITDFCRARSNYIGFAGQGLYDSWLTQYLNYLRGMEMENGSWGKKYHVQNNEREAASSPYYDGEALLAYCRAARYMQRDELVPRIERIAHQLAEKYTVAAWDRELDSELTKGFFQWGCMAFAEYVEAGWRDADAIGDAALALAWWQIHEHRVLLRRGNTAYAVEGLLGAYRIARARDDTASMTSLRAAVVEILQRLTPWQVGGPWHDRNPFLRGRRIPPAAAGGIMSAPDSGSIRIDTVQHQAHACLLALELLFPEKQ